MPRSILNATPKMAAKLGQNGYILVSSMAYGIDTAAHRGVLPTGTIGVAAGGVDMILVRLKTQICSIK